MLTYLYCYISSYFQDEEGQGMAEYGLILALVAVAVISALTLLGGQIGSKMGEVTSALGGGGG